MTAIATRANSDTPLQVVKLIAFEIGKLFLAVPISQVQKVVNLPQIDGSGLYPIGLTQVGDREVTVIDLNRQLFGVATSSAADYLVLIQTWQGGTLAIPVQGTPLLLEVPTASICKLPEPGRSGRALGAVNGRWRGRTMRLAER